VDGDRGELSAVALAATDPANPYGAALAWPTRESEADKAHRPGRKAGALVVLVDGNLVWFLERGGRSLLSFTDNAEILNAASAALTDLVSGGRVDGLLVERINGSAVLDPAASADHSAAASALTATGFSRTPRGLRLR
jgi:ATP-dependent Lhr-like helicase